MTPALPPEPHSHEHGSHKAPKVVLDDVSIHHWHHFPPSYLAADFRLDSDSAIFGEEFDESWDTEQTERHGGLMLVHVASMVIAYFGALPIGLALRSAGHPSHYLINAVFIGIATLGWLAGLAYKAATPNRYEGSVHGGFGNILLLLSISLAVLDSLGLIKRAIAYYKSPERNWTSLVQYVLRGDDQPDQHHASRYEMIGYTSADDLHEGDREEENHEPPSPPVALFAVGDDDEDEGEEEETLPAQPIGRRPPRTSLLFRHMSAPSRTSTNSTNSAASDGTLHDTPPTSASTYAYEQHKSSRRGAYDVNRDFEHPRKPTPSGRGAYDMHEDREGDIIDGVDSPVWNRSERKIGLRRSGEILLTWVRRTQVVIAYVCLLSGLATYTGMCRAGLINTCLAHLIKGSIFFGYGVLTFARYLGAYADLGWAWNRRPSSPGPSAEMIECFVIFLYGITNTWMERFGAQKGDPYTVKQVQHISIAVMFWFAGLMGMFLESSRVKKLLASVVGKNGDADPPSYSFSFNPLPALVIAVTGLAMAAHHQDYVFQVQIHSLWGILLAGGSAFRFLTYFFLFVRPPIESSLPSRPPTELLTSFGYAAGGIVFMLSDEEITWAAMRTGWDDMMAFLNFTVALTSLIFCWTVCVMGIKGMAVLRVGRKRQEGRV
ncbi:hypothetical protein TREMEDRAFT_69277 [Tremella mesenterica DSM 1558]|uniref:uncharacterized protein n=1 Tax=Tremella mesenterica (strain ATCC 24925 / CBS 8224 / DSM 1558 / NBRC 9311 / NRRL Y-6157 / RJB 2259-6 / UBC 559-6) TaxID=578456 RepID=UPI0003F48DB2|nr:uncharacterized protein TREMEDRAFT_69277 [Tremella mesenterica DSM 1558]EIW68262.1 hypothetical protein TREMEDRAFT_69277 [Tremella mesenterica DSM 1558]